MTTGGNGSMRDTVGIKVSYWSCEGWTGGNKADGKWKRYILTSTTNIIWFDTFYRGWETMTDENSKEW